MFYVKTKISSNKDIKVDLYEDEIYTQCPKCGKEIQIEPKELASIIAEEGLTSTNVYCEQCSHKIEK